MSSGFLFDSSSVENPVRRGRTAKQTQNGVFSAHVSYCNRWKAFNQAAGWRKISGYNPVKSLCSVVSFRDRHRTTYAQ